MNTVRALMVLSVLSACGAPADGRVSPAGAGGASGRGGAGGVSGAAGLSGVGGTAGIASGSQALTARVETPEGLELKLVTVACAGECVEVIAIARGGRPPYAFSWSDGVATDARELCPDARTTYEVSVSDTPLEDGEFPYAGQTTTAVVTAEVLQCLKDAGVDAGEPGADASVEPDAGAADGCQERFFSDPSCVTLVGRDDCFGARTFDLPVPLEVGARLCVEAQLSASSDFVATLTAGASCDLWYIGDVSPLTFAGEWTWQACRPVDARIERLGIAGFADPSTIRSVRYCPRCDF
jgi:hypothetical protein